MIDVDGHVTEIDLLDCRFEIDGPGPWISEKLRQMFSGPRPDSQMTSFRSPRIALEIARPTPTAASWDGWRVVCDDERIGEVVDEADLARIAGCLTNWAVSVSERFLVLHGACVRKGSTTLMLLGDTHAGKSTSSALLLQHGWELYSDEVIAIQVETGQIHPYPRRLFLRDGSVSALRIDTSSALRIGRRSWALLPPSLRSKWTEVATTPTTLIELSFDPAAPTRLKNASVGDAHRAIVSGSARSAIDSQLAFELGCNVAESVRSYWLRYANSTGFLRAVDEVVG